MFAKERSLDLANWAAEPDWQKVFSAVPGLISMKDAEGRLTFGNAPFLEYLGVDLAHLTDLDLHDKIYPDDWDFFVSSLKAPIASGEPRQGEFRLLGHDGQYHSFTSVVAPIEPGGGRTAGWVRCSVDSAKIRDARAAQAVAQVAALAIAQAATERELRDAAEAREEYFQVLFDFGSDATLVADENSAYVAANQAASHLLGYDREALVGMKVADVVAESPEWTEEEYRAFFETGFWRGELELRHKNGSIVPVEATAQTVDLSSGRIGISVLRDISERRHRESLQREFLTMVSHELRNPLTPIIGLSQFLLREKKFDAESLQEIIDAGLRMKRLVEDLLDTASYQAGHFELDRSRIDLLKVAEGVVEDARGLSAAHSVVLDGPDQPIFGFWDLGRLHQVLQNLVSNAITYSPQGGEVRVSLVPGVDVVTISVLDHGIGMTPEQASAVFEPFERTASAKAISSRGLGLGLHIAKLLVEAHGGRIRAESSGQGQGALFRVELPYNLPEGTQGGG